MTDGNKSSARLHFVVAVDQQRRSLSFCCEIQPLATIRTFGTGTPARCPFCSQENPVSASVSMKQNEEKV
jgi:hypothetical protein